MSNKQRKQRQHQLFTLQDEKGVVHRSGIVGNAIVSLAPDAGAKASNEVFSSYDTGDVQNWGGTSNDLPKVWREKIEKSTTAYPLLSKLVSIIYGRGLYYWTETIDESGNVSKNFQPIPEVDAFLMNNDLDFIMLQRLMDYKFSGNIFCEFILSTSLNKIVNITHLEAEFTRFGKISEDKSTFDQLLYNGDWSKPSEASPIPFLKRTDFKSDLIRKKFKSNKKFAMHSSFPSPGRTIYAFPPHGAVFKNDGWLDYANSVPVIMNTINKTAANIKYHVQIPYDYWKLSNQNWDTLEKDKQNEIIDSKLKEIDQFLKNETNPEATFYSHFATDPITGKPLSGWKIETINDNKKKDMYITSLQEADMQISRAWGIDSSLANIQPEGSSLGAGSGSDKRVGFDNQVNASHADIRIVVEPLYFIGKYNNWPTNLKWGFLHDVATTLNQNSSGIETK